MVIQVPDRLLDGIDFTFVEIRLTALTTDPGRHRIQHKMVAVSIDVKWCGRALHLALAIDTIHLLLLLIDEIDSLIGDTLISVLRQLRSGYDQRPESFPHSVVLCGVRDVRDYRIRSSAEQVTITGGSAFNIKAGSLRLGEFSEAEVRALLAQHTADTGQPFTPDALATVWRQTQGQPWLVNALCQEACDRTATGSGEGPPITGGAILDAQEQLILNRVTHLDQLTDKLQEERVRRVIEPLLSGASVDESSTRDLEYVRDLGLVAREAPPRMANPIYAEVVPRELTYAVQEKLLQDPVWYVDADGGLDPDKLLADFQGFFREHFEPRGAAKRGGGGALRLRRGGAATPAAGHDSRRVAADRRVHGPVRGAGGPPGQSATAAQASGGRTGSSAATNAPMTGTGSRCGGCERPGCHRRGGCLRGCDGADSADTRRGSRQLVPHSAHLSGSAHC